MSPIGTGLMLGMSSKRSSGVAADTTAPAVAVLSPNGGEAWAAGSVHNITWTATDAGGFGVNPIKLEYSLNNGGTWTTISAAAPNTGTFAWTLPQALSAGLALVRVSATDAASNVGTDVSNAPFTINDQSAPTVTLLSPNGGESLPTGTFPTVTWTPADNIGVTGGSLKLSTDNGATFGITLKNLTAGEAAAGSAVVEIPYPAGGANCKMRVTLLDAAGNSASDDSNAVFSIPNQISLQPIGTVKTQGSVDAVLAKSCNALAGDIIVAAVISGGDIDGLAWNGRTDWASPEGGLVFPLLGDKSFDMFELVNTVAALDDVTVNFSAEQPYAQVIIAIVRGAKTAGAPDRSKSAMGNGATPASGNTIATAQARELVLAWVAQELLTGNVSTGTWTGGYTDSQSVDSTDHHLKLSQGYKLVTATGVQSASKTGASALADWACVVRTYKEL